MRAGTRIQEPGTHHDVMGHAGRLFRGLNRVAVLPRQLAPDKSTRALQAIFIVYFV